MTRRRGQTSEREYVAMMLQIYGFTAREIRYILDAKTPDGRPQPLPDLRHPAWQQAMLRRQQDRERIAAEIYRATGKRPRKQVIDRVIDQSYAGTDLVPFDYVQAESLKGSRKPLQVDFRRTAAAIRRMRALRRTRMAMARARKLSHRAAVIGG